MGAAHAVVPDAAALRDATEAQALAGHAEALVRPGSPEEVAAVLRSTETTAYPIGSPSRSARSRVWSSPASHSRYWRRR